MCGKPINADESLKGKDFTISLRPSTLSDQATLSIRNATAADAPLLATMIRELAEYERELEMVSITEDDILRDGFGPAPKFRALIADTRGEPAGYALFFPVYSTWVGRPGMFLEDLFVRRQFRHQGIGKALLARVARIAVDEDCYGLRWEVLHWNQPAIELYQQLGATFPDQWRSVSLMDEALHRLAERAS
jgi:GNAT superfamily N-acetyltransferase